MKQLLFSLGFLLSIGISTCFSQSGVIDGTGKVIIPFEYRRGNIDKLQNSPYLEVRKKGFHGLMDADGKVVVPCEYDDIDCYSENMVRVELDRKYGFVDTTTGKLVIPCIYKEAGAFHDGLATIHKSGKEGLIDKTGKMMLFGIYEKIGGFHDGFYNGYAKVMKNGKWGFIDKKGNEVVPCKYEDDSNVGEFNENGITWFHIGEFEHYKFGFINTKGEEVIPAIYDKVEMVYDIEYENAAIAVNRDGKWGFLDAKGKEIVNPRYDNLNFREGFFYVSMNSIDPTKRAEGLVSVKGKELIPCEYDGLSVRSHIVEVRKNGKYGIFNLDAEKMISPCVYDHVNPLIEGKFIAVATKNGKQYSVDAKGKEKEYKNQGRIEIVSDKKYPHDKNGLKDFNGNMIVGYIYDEITRVTNDMFIVRKGGKEGIINGNGSVVVPLIYDSLYRLKVKGKNGEPRFKASKTI